MQCNTTAVVGTTRPDSPRYSIRHQQFVQHALGRTSMYHESVCCRYVPIVNKIRKDCSSNCIAGSSGSSNGNGNGILTNVRCRSTVMHHQDSTAAVAHNMVAYLEHNMQTCIMVNSSPVRCNSSHSNVL